MAREGLQFTQDRLKAGSWDLSETSKSSSVSGQYRIILSAAAAGAVLKPQGGNCAVLPQQTQPNFVLAKDPLFSLLSDAPQELAQIEIGKGEPGIRGGAGGTKSEWHICSKPAPRCKGRTASRWRACNPPNTHPPPQTPQTVCRGAVYPSRRKKNGNRAPQTCHPFHKAPTQPPGPAANRRMRNK